jgi:hypothetical protein
MFAALYFLMALEDLRLIQLRTASEILGFAGHWK